jgi:hypothetical protein
MASITTKHIKSKYKYVSGSIKTTNGKITWIYRFKDFTSKAFETEELAAKAVDLHLIHLGKEPVNILKRK